MTTGNDDEFVTVGNAAAVAGIPERTLRYWITNGKLPATSGKRGKLVRMGDVWHLAELTGKIPATNENQNTSAIATAGNVAAIEPEQWETFWAPIHERERERDRMIADQAERIGRLEAERDQLRIELEQAREAASQDESPSVTDNDAPAAKKWPWARWWERLKGTQ